ncbi:uncharacterized protein HD556DRAFT_1467804 [Suillus plorans]|uniref:Uncharacterized protein n=1 Tax=Suillus plorans TaxID=116603 RepID=A0A9P7DJU0_9AGAM|nr:uncharacterized protein HD556DRAFT_1467804 [Suillus plorans]KAG1796311.1 hypothetical protein HD556DRAFT_1467804 [Suillus plorans]
MFLPPGSVPEPLSEKTPDDWTPFRNRTEFETAEFFFIENQTPATQINRLLDLWASTLTKHNDRPPFADYRDLYKTIDNIPVGDVKWQSFSAQYTGARPDVAPPWMDQTFDVWYRDPHQVVRNMLGNPDYVQEFDYRPYREFSTDGDVRQWKDFMSGDWAWNQADLIATDPETHGSTFVPVVLGSDKTTVSVATGNNEYYPLYASIGNVHNNVRRAHREALAIVGFLAIPKTTKEHASDPKFHKFRRQLFQSSLAKILERLRPGMTKPEVVRFGDGHFRRVVYGLGPYIADYEEQVLLACIVRGWCARCLGPRINLDEPASERCREHTEALVEEATLGDLWDEYGIVGDLVPFTNDFPRADIHELIAPDLLHQLIKGTFKDHIVDWVEKYLHQTHGKMAAKRIMDDIDRRYQWTGDDSKALMKVYLPAIEGHVPIEVVQTFRAFLEFCYLVRRNIITEKTLDKIQDALDRFHRYREIFKTTEVVETFSLPRQHSLQHYIHLVRLFGAPNGLCSSITESKHIKAVKEPWRRSSQYKALGQMLVTNQRLDKLAAARTDFTTRGMLDGTCLSAAINALGEFNNTTFDIRIANDEPGNPLREDTEPEVNVQEDEDVGDVEIDTGPTVIQAHVELAKTPQRNRARTVSALALELSIPQLPNMLSRFLFAQLNPNDPRDPLQIPPADCPQYDERISVFNSACSRFFAPSDLSGIGGMRREHIRACPAWRKEHPRYDCIFVNTNPDLEGMRGMDVARVLTFFSFTYRAETYPCAVVRWFDTLGELPDDDTGMWMVQPAHHANNAPHIAIIHVDSIYRAAHLIPVYGSRFIPPNLQHYQTYDSFRRFYINKYADHHSFEIAS